MKHQLDTHLLIRFKDGTTMPWTTQYRNSLVPVGFQEVFKEESQKVESYLKENGFKQKQVESKELKLNYQEAKTDTPEENFFYKLLEKTEQVFNNASATKKKYPNQNWNFSICDTPIQKGKGLFFGLNWGGSDINQQSVYPPKEKDRNWKFVTNSRPFFSTYFKERIEDLNYSNLCFFRSPSMDKFVDTDWELALPLFEEYVDYIKPSWALMLGKPPYVLETRIENFKKHSVINENNGNRVFGYTGKLFGKYPFGGVPHTESHISSESRHEIWELVSNKLKENQ